jgi:predicted ferric reductase
MALIVRGMLWFGLYVFLALLPLATAVISNPSRGQGPLIREIAVGAGFVGYALMALEFALISRVKAAAMAFGEDALQLFHNLMGMVALLLLLAHPSQLLAQPLRGLRQRGDADRGSVALRSDPAGRPVGVSQAAGDPL